ncbi:hypothetical protein [Streptomyces sp. NPDC056921]|uniref:hypothetical protein n=1 Tax=Streptomyces sp. NPDC056921 TaxID=3345966 RepID=UPI003644BD84
MRTAFTVAMGVMLALTATEASAARPESGWVNTVGSARTTETPELLSFGGMEYGVVLGQDNRIWISYNSGDYMQHPVAHETRMPPSISVVAGRVVLVHVGVDNQLYYSFLQNGNANQWTGWRRVPGNAGADSAPTLTPFDGRLLLTIARADESVANQAMEVAPAGESFYTDYVTTPDIRVPRLRGYSPRIGSSVSHANNRTRWRFLAVGRDRRVWTGDIDPYNPSRSVPFTQLGDGGVCDSNIAAGQGGPAERVVAPGDPQYQAQQHQAIACVGNDGNVWTNQTSNGGETYEGWNRTTDGAGPSTSTPSLNGEGNSIDLRIRWNGNANPRFPDNSVVEKSLF